LRDAFAVLFFVSIGMLFDPAILVQQPLRILAVMGTIVIGKSIAAAALVLAFGYPYQRACDLISGQASVGHLGHQCSYAPGRPILHLVLSSRRPRREGVGYLISRSLFRAGGFCGYALTAIDLASKFRSRARTLQAMRASLLARAIASTL